MNLLIESFLRIGTIRKIVISIDQLIDRTLVTILVFYWILLWWYQKSNLIRPSPHLAFLRILRGWSSEEVNIRKIFGDRLLFQVALHHQLSSKVSVASIHSQFVWIFLLDRNRMQREFNSHLYSYPHGQFLSHKILAGFVLLLYLQRWWLHAQYIISDSFYSKLCEFW